MKQASAARKREEFASVPPPTESTGGKFDLRTHFFDHAGRYIGENPYRLHMGSFGELYERPVGSGNCFTSDGKPAGRMIYEQDVDGKIVGGKKHDPAAKHIDYKAPLKGTEKLVADLSAAEAKNKALEAELASIKKDQKGAKSPEVPTLGDKK